MRIEKVDDFYVFGEPVENAINQMKTAMKTGAVKGALMADHHLGYGVPVGGVIAYEDLISPSGVGFDIGCGNMAIKLDSDPIAVTANIRKIMDDIWKNIEFGIGTKNNDSPEDHELFYHEAWSIPFVSRLKQMARNQLGTVGAGNHYVDVFVDENTFIWIGVHFGSRGLGHKIASEYIKRAGGKDGIDSPPCTLEARGSDGEEYLLAMDLAGKYAEAGREWVCEKVRSIVGGYAIDTVHNHHNFAWREMHVLTNSVNPIWVIRKGATPAWPGQRGFVGSTMSEDSYIVSGRISKHSIDTMFSTVHGAGRVMSRTKAAGKWKRYGVWRCSNRDCRYFARLNIHKKSEGKLPKCPKCDSKLRKNRHKELKKPGVITTEERMEAIRKAGVELRGGGNDESPRAYKRLENVLESQGNTIEIEHTLTPIGVAMAEEDTYDPYKD